MAVGMSPEMPAWGGALEPAQIKALVAYVRGFCRGREASPSPRRRSRVEKNRM